jgi:endonuclease/exonuclease/phosphatase (EEP) superfamily protein YafD
LRETSLSIISSPKNGDGCRDELSLSMTKRLRLPSWFLPTLCVGLGAATFFGFFGRWSWFLDLFSHFRVVYAWGALLLAGWFLWQKRRKWGGAALFLFLVNLATIWPYLVRLPAESPSAKAAPLKLFHANVLVLNTNYAAVQEQIKAENPDIVALAELTPGWFKVLEPLKRDYPYFIRNHIGDRFGLGIWSKFPMTGEAIYLGAGARCSVLARVQVAGKALTILYTHPWPPSKAKWAAEQKQQLTAVAECVAAEPGPKLVLGDLNATPWSHLFRKLEHDSGLRDTERDGGIAFTWPAPLPIRIPIDHCLISKELHVLSRRAGRATGSDHLPLVLELAL